MTSLLALVDKITKEDGNMLIARMVWVCFTEMLQDIQLEKVMFAIVTFWAQYFDCLVRQFSISKSQQVFCPQYYYLVITYS